MEAVSDVREKEVLTHLALQGVNAQIYSLAERGEEHVQFGMTH